MGDLDRDERLAKAGATVAPSSLVLAEISTKLGAKDQWTLIRLTHFWRKRARFERAGRAARRGASGDVLGQVWPS